MTDKLTEYPSLAAALAAFQADLPTVNKGATGQVGQNRNYKYADLGDLNAAVLPKLAKVGLSFSTKPTLNAAGKFVLAYVLRHVSGEEDGGEWPLPDTGNSQAMGSAVTYARRYSLQAVTGVAPDEDDDGRAAGEYHHRAEPRRDRHASPATRPVPSGGRGAGTGEQAMPPIAAARARLNELCIKHGWDPKVIGNRFKAQHGTDLSAVSDPAVVDAFREVLAAHPPVPAAGGERR